MAVFPLGIDLLLCDDEQQARALVAQLRTLNAVRRDLSRQILHEAELQVEDGKPLIFVSNPAWQPGVLGLVAGRLSERFGRPAVAVGGYNGAAVGSARSPASVNILDFLSEAKEHLLKFGGHAQAAGFSLRAEKVERFRHALAQQVHHIPIAAAVQEIRADAVLGQQLVTPDTADLLERFAPHGMGNAEPVFVGKKLRLAQWRPVGRTREHAKCTFLVEERPVDGIGFGLAASMKHLADDMVDVLFHLEMNEFRGRRTLQLRVNDIVAAGSVNIVEAPSYTAG